MILKLKWVVCPSYKNISKRLISNEIKEVFNAPFETPDSTDRRRQLLTVSKNLVATNLDLFVNNLDSNEDRSSDVLNLLVKLRATKLANTCLDSTHFGVVKHLLSNLTMKEILPILVDRPKYGIFLDDFTSFAVFQTLYDEKEYIIGLPLALKLILSDEVNSMFVHGFCLKASLETLKRELSREDNCDDKDISAPKAKVQEKKVRVKFLRNEEQPDIHNEMGKATLKIESRIREGDLKTNAKILALVLTKNYSELCNELSKDSTEINADIANICKNMLLRENQQPLIDKICKLQSNILFEQLVDEYLKDVSVQEAPVLAEKQKLKLPIWKKLRLEKELEYQRHVLRNEREENIKVTTNEIASKKDLLWFFDNEDKLDLEIFNKKVYYPKKWFGKKKKPRVVDEHYVPPEIRKIN